MTEEEKKAIEVLKEEIKSLEEAKIEFSNEIEDKGWLQKNINALDKDIFYKNTLLNLIEKLQKENEELRQNCDKATTLLKEIQVKYDNVERELLHRDKIIEYLEDRR